MYKWNLERPLAVFDIEATGVNPRMDRIIELSVIKLLPPKGEREIHSFLINPGIPIPPESTAIHGIKPEDVAGKPSFKDLAKEIFKLLDGCDLAGYNVIRFDLPMLIEEFLRASIQFDIAARRIVDAQRIFHKKEPRDLTAALKFYCDEFLLDGHRAEADALATLRVLEGQLNRYKDLPSTMDELARYCDLRDPTWADRDGKLRWLDGEIAINFGRKKGEKVSSLVHSDPGFLKWMLKGDFASDTKAMIQKLLNGQRVDPLGSALGDQLKSLKETDADTG